MSYRTQRLIAIIFMGILVNSCNFPTSSITATPPNSPFPGATPSPTSPFPSATPSPTNIPGPNEYIVIAQLNLWYFGAGCNGGFEDSMHCSGRRTTPFEPALGHTYTSSDSRVIQQQIDWAADYGVDAFSLEWTTPRGIGTSGSLEDNIDDAFLKAPNLARIRWCIFYDTILRITQDPAVNANISNGVNFDDPKVYNAFVSDFDHFATKYFAQPQYLKIDGRPVIYIYAAWNFHGNFAGAIKDARTKALAQGYDVFIVGDALRADTFSSKLVSQFDANTTFTFLIPGLPTYSDMGKTAPAIDKFFQTWRKKIQDLTVVGRNETVNFQPGWAPQFDNRLFGDGNPIYVPALSKDQVTAMAQVARDNAEPVGSLNQKLVWINTWNNWAEATTIEPTANQGAKYPTGNYQFDMLEIVRDIFGQQSFGNGPPFPATEISNAPGVPAPEFTQIPNISSVDLPAGNWTGKITSKDGSFSTVLNLSFQPSCSINEVCGTYEAPQIQCSGTLTLVSAEENSFVFIEKTTSSSNLCINTCYEYIQKLPEGSITYGCSRTGNSNDIVSTGTLNQP